MCEKKIFYPIKCEYSLKIGVVQLRSVTEIARNLLELDDLGEGVY